MILKMLFNGGRLIRKTTSKRAEITLTKDPIIAAKQKV